MMRSFRNESFRLNSPSPESGSYRRSSLASRNSPGSTSEHERSGSMRSMRSSMTRTNSSPGLAIVEHLQDSCTEEAFLYRQIKKMSDEEKEVLLGQIMQGTSAKAPRRRLKKKTAAADETGNALWTPRSAKTEKRKSMKKVLSSGSLSIRNLKMPF